MTNNEQQPDSWTDHYPWGGTLPAVQIEPAPKRDIAFRVGQSIAVVVGVAGDCCRVG
ncbi:hypothetical protein [Curtobacterium citreum]|uniref:Uncharacterized protein n=1 Tax=Curtobacterium citreum TaxID=2036 RepID=A0ABU8YBV8_9MICO